MAQLIKVEESSYVQDIVDSYAANKVGQYSKYLNQTPTFVTYYSINQIMSRADTGTGTVYSETGYNSSLRFNKIKGLPVYNIPLLSPEVIYDETGMSLEMDLSDVVLLPNTVKPTVPDYMIIHLPEGTQALFRVNSFRYNTIQSNEFVYITLEIKDFGEDIESKLESQVVKTFYTVFDNIGTEDKCFIEEEAIASVNTLVDTINECIETYRGLYWDETIGTYLLHSKFDSSKVIYDVFLTKFINSLNLFPHNASKISTLAYLDYVPHGSEYLYRRSLLYAIEAKTSRFMVDNLYYYLSPIANPCSPLNVFHYDALSVKLKVLELGATGEGLFDYYDKILRSVVIAGITSYPTIPENTAPEDPSPELPDDSTETDGDDNGDTNNMGTEGIIPDTPITDPEDDNQIDNPSSTEMSSTLMMRTIEDEFESSIPAPKKDLELTEEDYATIESYTDDQRYVLDTITKYMANTAYNVDVDKIVKSLINSGRFSYFYGPLIICILKKTYDAYFSSANGNDLAS